MKNEINRQIKPDAVVSCSSANLFGINLASQLGLPALGNSLKQFPDSELSLHIQDNVKNKNIVLVASFFPLIHRNIFEFLFTADALTRAGCKSITGVVPYLAYSRQDRIPHQGAPLSFSVVGQMLGNCNINKIFTLELHNPDTANFFNPPLINLDATDSVSEFIREKLESHLEKPLILSPDQGRAPWAERLGKRLNYPSAALNKKRISERKVEIECNYEITGKDIIFVDDMIATGGSLSRAIKVVLEKGARSVYCIAVHGLFVEYAESRLFSAGAEKIYVTNTIPSEYSSINVSVTFAKALLGEL